MNSVGDAEASVRFSQHITLVKDGHPTQGNKLTRQQKVTNRIYFFFDGRESLTSLVPFTEDITLTETFRNLNNTCGIQSIRVEKTV